MFPMDESADREGRLIAAIPADTFGVRLMLVRAHAGHITVKDAAEKCGLNYGSWSNWERGKMPRDLLDVVESISEGLGIDRDWLLHGGALTRPSRKSRVRLTSLHSPARPGARRPRRVDGVRRRPAA